MITARFEPIKNVQIRLPALFGGKKNIKTVQMKVNAPANFWQKVKNLGVLDLRRSNIGSKKDISLSSIIIVFYL